MIILPARFTQRYIEEHPDWIFVYGDAATSIDCGTSSYMGQSAFAGYYAHCMPIATKWKNCKSDAAAYFHDTNFEAVKSRIEIDIEDILKASNNKAKPIILFPKIGCGCAELNIRPTSKRCYEHLVSELDKIKSPQKIDYKLPII